MKIELGTATINKNKITITLYDEYSKIGKSKNLKIINKNVNIDFIEKDLFQVFKNDYEKILYSKKI